MANTTTAVRTAQRYGGFSRELVMAFLMSKLPLTGHDHRHSVPIGRFHHLAVADGSPGLNDRGHTSTRGELDAVGKGKECVRGEHAAARLMSLLPRLVHRQKNAVHPAHLPGTDADGRFATGEQDGVRLDRGDSGP